MFARAKSVAELSARLDHYAHNLARLAHELEELRKRFDGTASAVMRAELDDLRGALEVDRIALRRQLGKIWGRIGRESRDVPENNVEDDELRAWLNLQESTKQ